MNTISTMGDVTRSSTGACPVPTAVSNLLTTGLVAGARHALPAGYVPAAAGASFGKHSEKQTDMARIDATGWPLGPQDRMSG